MQMAGPVSSVRTLHENHNILSQLPPRIPARKFAAFQMEAKRDDGQNSGIESIYMSSDDAD